MVMRKDPWGLPYTLASKNQMITITKKPIRGNETNKVLACLACE